MNARTQAHACIQIHIHVHMFRYMHVQTVQVCTVIHVYMYMCMYMYMYIAYVLAERDCPSLLLYIASKHCTITVVKKCPCLYTVHVYSLVISSRFKGLH